VQDLLHDLVRAAAAEGPLHREALVERRAEAEDVAATVDALCDGIRAGAPGAVAETKRLLSTVPGTDRTAAFTEMAALSDRLFASTEAAEGMAAFAEKRPPDWSTT
jgi:enoyl-CoA hydratase/carnithine racemase